MSHFTTIQTQVRDIHALSAACAELGLAILQNTPVRGYAGSTRNAEHTICLNGPYDIAVDRDPENAGAYSLTADWWDGHVSRQVGMGFSRLLQSYGVHKTLHEARSRGLRATRKLEADGSILLTLEGGSL